jgi:hypothetical protein
MQYFTNYIKDYQEKIHSNLHVHGFCIYIYFVDKINIYDFNISLLINYEVSSDCCLTPNEKFVRYIMVITSYIPWDDDDAHFGINIFYWYNWHI